MKCCTVLNYDGHCQAREGIIRKIKKIIEDWRKKIVPTSSIGVLGKLLEEECLSDEAIADFVINLLFAGNETTAWTMLFAVYFLTRCPAALEQLLVRSPYCSAIFILLSHCHLPAISHK